VLRAAALGAVRIASASEAGTAPITGAAVRLPVAASVAPKNEPPA